MKSSIITLFAIGCSILHLLATPSLVGEWTTSFGRYAETVTYKTDGKFVRVTEIVRGPNQEILEKSTGNWKLDGEKLEQTTKNKSFITKIKFIDSASFEEPSELGNNGVLVYQKIEAEERPAPAPNKITHPKIGSPERKAIMDAMRGPVSKYAGKEVIFTGDLSVLDSWAKLSGHVNPKDGGKFPEDHADEMEMDFLAILKMEDGKWKLAYHGWSGDVGASIEAREKLPNVPEALLPKIQH